MPRQQVNIRLSAAARRALAELAVRWGVSQAAVLEVLLRERAQAEGVPWAQEGAR